VAQNEPNGGRWVLPETLLPEGDVRPLWVDDGRITARPVPDAERLPGRFASPGLVDAHIHMALGDRLPLGMDEALKNLRAARDQGVLLVRDMGAPGSLSLDLPEDPLLPRVIACGRQLAVEGGFFPECHQPVPPEELVEAALAEVGRGATWVKVLTDWTEPRLTYPVETLREMVDAVHAAGARVAAHNQRFGLRDVVSTGVDSIEHGTAMDEETLVLMADRGVVWVPTASAMEEGVIDIDALLTQDDIPDDRRLRLEEWRPIAHGFRDTVATMVPIAARRGVTLLASTDNARSVAEEVESFVRYGLDPVVALRSATTEARRFLHAPGLDDGAPADVVTFDRDPRQDITALREPVAILLGGVRIR
jgi:imidazolonepropionase-like amidohydrolase